MNYGELKQNIIDLGFSDADELEEFGTLVPNAINRAITEISMSVAPNTSYKDIVQDDTFDDEAYYEYEMPDDFMKFAEVPVKRNLASGVYERFNDFEIEDDNVIMSGSHKGTFRLFYVADHEAFTVNTSNGEDIPLPLKAHYLVPLLASYYIWLDDDQTKAQMYYQAYQQGVQTMAQEVAKPRGRIRTDWGDGIWL